MNYEGYETGPGQTPCTKRIGLKAARERDRGGGGGGGGECTVLSQRNNIGSAAEDSLSPRLRNVNVTIQTRAKRVTYSEFLTQSGWINWENTPTPSPEGRGVFQSLIPTSEVDISMRSNI